jgi:hypothetical protein
MRKSQASAGAIRQSVAAALVAILAMLAGYATILWDARQRGLARLPASTFVSKAAPRGEAAQSEGAGSGGSPAVTAERGESAAARTPREIYEQQRGIALQAIDMMNRSMEIGAPVVGMPTRVVTWSVVLLQAELYLSLDGQPGATDDPEVYLAAKGGGGDPTKVKLFEDHLHRMRLWEDRFRPLQERGAMSALEFFEFQSARVRAEGWLARELGTKK